MSISGVERKPQPVEENRLSSSECNQTLDLQKLSRELNGIKLPRAQRVKLYAPHTRTKTHSPIYTAVMSAIRGIPPSKNIRLLPWMLDEWVMEVNGSYYSRAQTPLWKGLSARPYIALSHADCRVRAPMKLRSSVRDQSCYCALYHRLTMLWYC